MRHVPTVLLQQLNQYLMKVSHIVLILILAVAVGLLITTVGSFGDAPSFAVAEAQAGETFKITGTLEKDQPIKYDPTVDANRLEFMMKDKEGVVKPVVFLGTKPQEFERSEQVVLTGKMVDGTFYTDEILTKCPSKYKDEEIRVRAEL